LDCCLYLNNIIRKQSLGRFFAIVSRLGDGIFWYLLMACLILAQGVAALAVVGRMMVVGALCLVLYKWLKSTTTRPRPFTRHGRIRVTVAPLDQYSFPSGHTLHAVAFSAVVMSHYPRLGWLVLPFTLLVMLSRLVLGLHYPSDVLAGVLLGVCLAILVLRF
jgi:undecaprenyl-diphosphatase